MAETPHERILKVLEMIHLMHREPCTMEHLIAKTGRTKRTVYRYLNVIEELGIEINGRGKGSFSVMTINHCPICSN